ncbi:LuxR C-terminal-related transcriptional regulator [Kitasatospora sp. DSM 101779]|uniref:LuxR C-terminal-related transcriptional regulator n=1 Tax=Kitasatospora sp. DSM 101779 TaxID=2853165 RepID=UPI0021D90CC5|nr:LuxR C-terminal-related transcriptional regulator [Kitasatospora sp. DSM 101779]MCU7824376.1 LuxR C-terminal-related transcriptional regulator [Kitasatospora sp. DSM 101779]
MTAPSKADRAGDDPTGPTNAARPAAAAPSARVREDAARLLQRLTPREAQVVARVAAGDDDRAVAAALGVAPATVRKHLNRAMRKLGVGSRAEAARLAALLGTPGRAAEPAPPDPTGVADPVEPGPAPAPVEATAEPAPDRAPEEARQGPRRQPPEPVRARPPAPSGPPVGTPRRRPEFAAFSAAVHTRLVQQTYLVTGSPHRAARSVRIALGAAALRWDEVAELPDPEGWVRAAAFESALSPWRRGGPRRAGGHRLPHRTIKVKTDRVRRRADESRPTARDRALLTAMHRLSRPQRRAVVLHDAVGLPVAAVAEEVESSTAAAEGRVRAAREELARTVPGVVGADPSAPGFGPALGALLFEAAVRACPSPRTPSAARLATAGRRRAHAVTGAAGLLTLGMAGAMVVTLVVGGPDDTARPARPAAAPRTDVSPPPEVCSSAGTGSSGPAAPGREPGLRSPWCSPTGPRPSTGPAGPAEGGTDAPDGTPSSGNPQDGTDGTGGGTVTEGAAPHDGQPVAGPAALSRPADALPLPVPCAPLWPCPTLAPAEVPRLLP